MLEQATELSRTMQHILETRGYVVICCATEQRIGNQLDLAPWDQTLRQFLDGPLVVTAKTNKQDMIEQNLLRGLTVFIHDWPYYYRVTAE